ncbi:hypothetical protein Ahy_B06g082091 [Arachis hypogaea]|uniref:Endonuclease/exonuclease/phosphatase domain-containing protein n=1 Tax=Arachis hypogaea TaxID=3818 RepID=A0A444YMS6_ARAHY|nr:hypothetical protein Ahy_B06g082091 [Arachis hypogaea]
MVRIENPGSSLSVIFVLGDAPFSVYFVMNIISWNCRGAGGKTFPNLIRDIRREYNANFIILLETHISGSRGAAVREKLDLIVLLLWKLMVIREEFGVYGTRVLGKLIS